MMRLEDPSLPGLAASLDVDGFLARLGRTLPECRDGLEIEEGRIFDVQYRPGRESLVLYRLKLRESATGRSRRQYLSVRALGSGQRPRRPSERAVARYEALEGRGLRTPYLEMPEQQLAAYAFPMDPVLDTLLPALDPEGMRGALQQLWRDRGVRVRRVTARSLGYTPQARAAIRYEVLCETRDTGVPEVRHLVGKIHAHKPAAGLFASAWALWRAAKLRVRLAPPVGFLAGLDLSLQEWMSGQRLGDLAEMGAFVKAVRQTARSIAVIHGLQVPTASRRTAAKEAASVHRWGDVLAAVRPDRARRVEALRDRLAARLADCARVNATVHGDFHPANVLAPDDHVTLIDVDQLALGDPMIDVGRFLASLRVSSLRMAGDPDALRPARESFLEQYLAQRDEDEERARLFEAACLLTAAATGFRLQRPGWEENAGILLEEAERVLERAARSGRRVRGPDPPCSGTRDREGRRALAADPVYVGAALAPPVRERYGADLRSCRIRACGRGRRRGRVLRYRLEGVRDGRRWRRELQAWAGSPREARRALDALERLRSALSGRPDAPRLPEPVSWLRALRVPVLEDPEGEPLIARVGTPAGAEAGRRTAAALLALHAVPVAPEAEHPPAGELQALRRRAARLDARDRVGDPAAAGIAARAEELIREAPEARGPVLRRIPLDRVLCCADAVAFADVYDLALSHPLLDAGELLARLATAGVERGCEEGARAMADGFREDYLAGGTAGPEMLGAFEALALVRVACTRTGDDRPDTIQRLLALAETALART